ncbi:hypothetical protein HHK36_009327 [Tetracentron sinense]|uniref:FAS1 domain-containing protein n=1 Tax=Tetracentron sinense TaxID=13715 RepID=A0A834ZCR0_TETSI|nr:hypothetical protein HHK36_009327 [Tetracentron sinense]
MASIYRFSVKLLTITFIFLLSLPYAVNGIPEQELQAMLSVLRAKGYNLFGNAITTSDIHYEILAGASFTFFAPTDSALFALDMTATASDYIQTLRYHVALRRFSVANFRFLPSDSSLRTLLPRHDIHVSRRRSPESLIITVDGVDVVFPGLYYGRDIAVHGLGGILSLRSPIGTSQTPPPANLSSIESFPPNNNGIDTSTRISPGPEPSRIGISPGSESESQDISPAPDFLFPENGFPVNPPCPAYSDNFPPLVPKIQAPDSPSSDEGFPVAGDTYSDSDGYARPMRPELRTAKKSDVSVGTIGESEEKWTTESAILGENPMMPSLRDEMAAEFQANSPEFSSPLDAGTVECQATDDDEGSSHVSYKCAHPHVLQHYTEYIL